MRLNIGIRREDKNKWERRAPLIPSHVHELVKTQALKFSVQTSAIRIFSDKDYRNAGAEVSENLDSSDIILSIKEIPIQYFEAGKVYVFFSHTTKGQESNRPMLKHLMDLGCTLIDYEKIRDSKDRRLVFFGIEAGQAGMIETLSALGRRLDSEGTGNPFSELEQAYRYASLVEAKEAVQTVGTHIRSEGLDKSCLPLICGFAGYGRVSQGAQEIFDCLPHEEIQPEELDAFMDQGAFSRHKAYKVVFKENHMVLPKGKHPFDLQDYYSHPERYQSVFFRYLPHLSLLINAIYWAPQYPHFVSREDLKPLWEEAVPPLLKVIGDISCDIEGGVACTHKITDPDQPTYVYDPVTDSHTMGIAGRGVVIMAIDNLPCQIPLESSIAFSESLKSFIVPLASADYSRDFAQLNLPDEIKRAIILLNGKLTDQFAYMNKYF